MLRALILLLLTVPVAGIAAPVPRDFKKPVLYFPTTVGTKWVYIENGIEVIEVIDAVEKKDGKFVVTLNCTIGSDQSLESQILVSEQGLFSLFKVEKKQHPLALLKLPTKLGEQWETENLEEKFKVVHTIGAIEEVELPAGKFRTVRVDRTITFTELDGEVQKSSTWYAPGVGEVKSSVNLLEDYKVLKSFKPAKK